MAGRRDLARKTHDIAEVMLVANRGGKFRWIEAGGSQLDRIPRERDDALGQRPGHLVIARIDNARGNRWGHDVGASGVRAFTPPDGGLGPARVGLSHVSRQGSSHRIHPEDPYPMGAGRLEQSVGATPGQREGRELCAVGDVVHDRRVTGDNQICAAVEGVSEIAIRCNLEIEDRTAGDREDRIGKEAGSGIRRGPQGDAQPAIVQRDCGIYSERIYRSPPIMPAGGNTGCG
jgi:hypothetical protein